MFRASSNSLAKWISKGFSSVESSYATPPPTCFKAITILFMVSSILILKLILTYFAEVYKLANSYLIFDRQKRCVGLP